jgi:Wnt-binding factor required for Wnt secretion
LYSCSLLPLFELGALHHDFYLLNLRFPISYQSNQGLGPIADVFLIAINQNGGFTKVWISLKTVFFPLVIGVIIWFWRRVKLLARPPTLLESMLLALGITLSLLNRKSR